MDYENVKNIWDMYIILSGASVLTYLFAASYFLRKGSSNKKRLESGLESTLKEN